MLVYLLSVAQYHMLVVTCSIGMHECYTSTSSVLYNACWETHIQGYALVSCTMYVLPVSVYILLDTKY